MPVESRPHKRLGRPSRFVGYATVLLLSACVLLSVLLVRDPQSSPGGMEGGIGMFCVAPALLLLGSLQAVALVRRSVWAAWSVAVVCLFGAGVSGMALLPLAVGGDAVGLVAFGTLCAASALGGVANLRWARERPANPQRGFETLPPH